MAVYTDISDDELDRLMDAYGLGELLSCKGIAEGVENSNFMLHTETGYYILTLYEKRVSKADLPFFLGLMQHLVAKGFVAPSPIPLRNGDILGEVAGRPAAVIEFLEGRSIKRITPEHCALLGDTLARLHVAARDFPLTRANSLTVNNWRPLYENSLHSRPHPLLQDNDVDEILAELDILEKGWPVDLPQGVIHADLFPDNIFFLNNRVSGVIDYYFACNDFLSFDIAVCLNAWCFEADGSFNVTKAHRLLQRYQDVRSLDAAELQALPLLCRGAALRFYLTRLYDWINQVEGALVKPKDSGEYLRKLRFHQQVETVSAYGLNV
jgi:homoserine kinase type II